MNLTFTKDLSEEDFNRFTYNHPQATFFQSSNWSKVKLEWTPIYTGVYADDQLVGAALVLKRKIILNYSLMYLPRGPVIDFNNKEILNFYLDQLKVLAKDHSAISLAIDPYLINDQFNMQAVMNDLASHKHLKSDFVDLFEAKAFKHLGYVNDLRDSYQPRFTPILDVKTNDDYKKSTGYKNGEKALKNNVSIERNPQDAVKRLDNLINQTEEYKSISLREAEYFKRIQDAYGDDCLITIASLNVEAEVQSLTDRKKALQDTIDNSKMGVGRKNEYMRQVEFLNKQIASFAKKASGKKTVDIAALIGLKNASKSELLYAGTNRDFFRYSGSNLNYYDAINWSKEHNLDLVSFGGCTGTFDHGIDKYKATYNPTVIEYVGEFTYVNKKIINHLFRIALKIKRN